MLKKPNKDYDLWKSFKEGNDRAFYFLYGKYAENSICKNVGKH